MINMVKITLEYIMFNGLSHMEYSLDLIFNFRGKSTYLLDIIEGDRIEI